MKTKKLLLVPDVAECLSVSEELVRRWLREKKLIGVKLNTQWRIEEKDLRKFIDENKTSKE